MLGDSAVDRSISGVEKMSKIPERVKKMALDRDFQPSVRIGKTGVTESIVQEIKDQLAKRKIVKIKIEKKKIFLFYTRNIYIIVRYV